MKVYSSKVLQFSACLLFTWVAHDHSSHRNSLHMCLNGKPSACSFTNSSSFSSSNSQKAKVFFVLATTITHTHKKAFVKSWRDWILLFKLCVVFSFTTSSFSWTETAVRKWTEKTCDFVGTAQNQSIVPVNESRPQTQRCNGKMTGCVRYNNRPYLT